MHMTFITAIDIAKAAADIRITALTAKGYSITSDLPLTGRGIHAFGNGNFDVTESAMTRLEATYNVQPDF